MHVSNLEGPRHSLAWPIYSCGHGSEHWYSSGNDLVFLVVQLYICWRLKLLRPVKAQSLPLQSSKSLLENLSFTVKKKHVFHFCLEIPLVLFLHSSSPATFCHFYYYRILPSLLLYVIVCYCHHPCHSNDDYELSLTVNVMFIMCHCCPHVYH